MNYDTTQFKTGALNAANAAESYVLELKNIMGKVDVKDNAPIQKLADKIYLNYHIIDFKTSTQASGYQLELNSISEAKINLNANDVLKNSSNKLVLDYDTDVLTKEATKNQLTVKTDADGGITSSISGLKVKLPASSGLEVGTTGLKINLYPLTSGLELNATGLKINTATTGGLILRVDGIGISETYKTELTSLKTQAQTDATASETAKDAAIVARTAAQTSQIEAATSATAAATSAGTAGTEAGLAAGSAGLAAGSAGAEAGSAGAEAGSAGAAAGSAGAAAGSAAAALGSSTASGISSTAVVLGLSGKAEAYHYHSQYLETTTFDTYTTALDDVNILKDLAWDTKLDVRWKKSVDSNVVYFDTLSNPARRVGIGKADPSTLLDVNGTINATGFTLNGTAFTGGTNGTNGKGWTGATYMMNEF